jgi:hypothetical protein
LLSERRHGVVDEGGPRVGVGQPSIVSGSSRDAYTPAGRHLLQARLAQFEQTLLFGVVAAADMDHVAAGIGTSVTLLSTLMLTPS